METIYWFYSKLLKEYGPQGWWPTTSVGRSVPEYLGGPRNHVQKLEVIFGAILTQSTSWKNAEKAIISLNKEDLIDISKLCGIDESRLSEMIRPSGYYNQKAKKLKEICQFLMNNPLEELEKLDTERLREKLLSVKGVGMETADSIILYSFGRPIFVVDAYAKRMFARIGICRKDVTYVELQEIFHKSLKADAHLFNEYHALIVEHCKRCCRKKPLCGNCFLEYVCKKKL
jgi:endonuclease-3 related protein